MGPDAAAEREGEAWTTAVEEADLLASDGADHDQELFLDGITTPVLFASAISNFGVAALLETLVELAPAATPFTSESGEVRDVASPFSAFVFKVQAGMDTNHRDRVAFARVTSGVFERGMVVTHAQTGRPFATKYAQAIFGRERAVLDTANPGDIIGLVNATALKPGDTIFFEEPVRFPPIATFAPEHFAVATSADSSRFKQFRRGIDQLDSEGVVQVLRSDLRGNQSPVLAAVGPMQFEVAQARMESEFGAPIRLEMLAYTQARRTDVASAAELDSIRSIEVLARNDGTLLALAPDKWRLSAVERDHPELTLEPLLAGDA
jgi:peptide chain release factor 3